MTCAPHRADARNVGISALNSRSFSAPRHADFWAAVPLSLPYTAAMNPPSDLHRYARLIHSMMPAKIAFEPAVEDPTRVQVERGLNLPIVELRPNQSIQVVDAGGHARPVYRSLLVYNWLLELERAGTVPALIASINPWIQTLDEGIFSALVLATAGMIFNNALWIEDADRRFDQMIGHQQVSGAFFADDSTANPEIRWYDELIALHAIGSYALRRSDAPAAQAAQRSALFHLDETQPDHASAQPWGLLAFAQFAAPMADQLLHALKMQYPGGVTGVPLLLLTDALYGLQRLIADE
jgi:hypothetical protein